MSPNDSTKMTEFTKAVKKPEQGIFSIPMRKANLHFLESHCIDGEKCWLLFFFSLSKEGPVNSFTVLFSGEI